MNEDTESKRANKEQAAEHLIDPITQAFRRMVDRTEEFKEKVREWLRTQEGSQTCPNEEEHRINFDLTAEKSWTAGEFVAVYDTCKKCLAQGVNDYHARRLGRMGIPANLMHCRLSNWVPTTNEDKAQLQRVIQWKQHGRGILVIHGGHGLGKSHIGVALIRDEPDALFITQGQFLKKLRDRYNNERATDIIERCQKVKVLVFDEIQSPQNGKDEFHAVYEVFNERYGQGLRTVMTTNIEKDDVERDLGTRVADRLKDARQIELKGKSKRGRKD